MNYQQVSFIIMAIVFISYVSYILLKFGWLPSISESYYRLPRKQKPLFTLFCWGFAFPAILAGNSTLMFFAGAGILFVGAAAMFKEKMTKQVHYAGAISGIVCGLADIILTMHLEAIVYVAASISLLLLLNKANNLFFWIEIIAFMSILVALCIKLF